MGVVLLLCGLYVFNILMTMPVSDISSYIDTKTQCTVVQMEQTNRSIYVLFASKNSQQYGIAAFDKKVFGRCAFRMNTYADDEPYAYDLFQTAENGQNLNYFVCGGMNNQRYETLEVTLEGVKYSKNILKKPFLFVMESIASPGANTAPEISFQNDDT